MLEDINKLQNTEDKSLARAASYIDKNQNQQAIEILEDLTKSSLQTASKYLILAGVYQREGLYQLAEEKCKKALDLAEDTQDFETQVVAKAGLAQIQMSLPGKQDEAKNYLQTARKEFETVDNEVKERLNCLEDVVNGEQQLLFAVLGDCSGCNGQINRRWAGFGINRRCISCFGG